MAPSLGRLSAGLHKPKSKCFVFLDGKPDGASELLAVEGVLDWLSLGREAEGLPWDERRTESEGIARIHGVVADENEQSAVYGVCSRLSNDVDRGAAGGPEFCRVVAAVDLELLHRILADVQTYSARVIVGLAAIHHHAVASSVTPVKRETALRRLLHSEICVAGNLRGIAHAW